MEELWVKVAQFDSPQIAEIYFDLLEEHGIQVRKKGASLAGLAGEIPFGEAFVELHVEQRHAQQALALIHSGMRDEDNQEETICSHCSEKSPASFRICWNCEHELSA